MDFDTWIRGQLDPEVGPQTRPRVRPRRLAPRFPVGLVQVIGGLTALAVIAASLPPGGPLPALQLSVVTANESTLPANTWAGVPPQPTDNPEHPAAGEASPGAAATNPATGPGSGVEHGAEPTPGEASPQSTPASSPAGSSKTYVTQGGTATLSCQGSQVSLLSAAPNPGYVAEAEIQNGGSTIEVRFRSDIHQSLLEASCDGGRLQGTVQESSS